MNNNADENNISQNRRVTIEICGEKVPLITNESDKYLSNITTYVNEKITTILNNRKITNEKQMTKLIMLGIYIADDYMKEIIKSEMLENQIKVISYDEKNKKANYINETEKELKNQALKNETETAKLKKQIDNYNKQLNSLQDELNVKDQELAALIFQKENVNLEEIVDSLVNEEIESLKKDLLDKNSLVQTKNNTIEDYENQLMDNKKTIENYKVEIRNKDEIIVNFSNENEISKATIEQLSNEKNVKEVDFKLKVKKLNTIIDSLRNQRNINTNEIIKKNIEDINNTNKLLDEKTSQYNAIEHDLVQKNTQLQSLEAKLSQKDLELKKLKTDYAKIQNELHDYIDTFDK